MTENLAKKPKRGILKQTASMEQKELEASSHSSKAPHFDEKNILETLHPEDKDYGFMKIDEPKTPYEYASGVDEEDNENTGDSEINNLDLAARIAASEGTPRPRRISEPSGDEEDLALLTPEERERRRQFELKRKKHYNEFYAVKMARQLMEKEEEEEEGGGGEKSAEQGKAPDAEILDEDSQTEESKEFKKLSVQEENSNKMDLSPQE